MARGRISNLTSFWKQRETDHKEKQLINPFSEWDGASHRVKLDKTDAEYATPISGSKTAERGHKANELLQKEIRNLIQIMKLIGERCSDGLIRVTFGRLFNYYISISNKLVGILLRARKQGCVDFEGEMLWQGRDDDVVIVLRLQDEFQDEDAEDDDFKE